MADREQAKDAASRLSRAGEGELLEELRLNGEVELADGRSSSTSLCRTRQGLWLVLLRGRPDEDLVDLLAADRKLRYRPQMLGDRLLVDDWRLGVPLGRGEQAQRMIALVRVARAFGPVQSDPAPARGDLDHPDGPWSWSGPFVDAIEPRERSWLLRWLDADERLLVWQVSEERQRFDSPILADADGRRCLVITERRQALVAVSAVGDIWTWELPASALEVDDSSLGRALVRTGDQEFRVPLGDEKTFAIIAELPALGGVDRLRAFARALWLRAGRDPQSASALRAATILDRLGQRDPLSVLTRALLVDPLAGPYALAVDTTRDESGRPPLPAAVHAALAELAERGAEGGAELVDWWRGWQVGPELAEVVVEHLCELGRGGLELALPLHERLRPKLQAKLDAGSADAAVLDFVLVEHLLALGHARRALRLLDARRDKLPSEALQDLLPPSPERGGQLIRIELHELTAAAHEQLGDGHVAALAELARLQPLVQDRVDALIDRLEQRLRDDEAGDDTEDEEALLHRARVVRAILDEDGFAPDASFPAAEPDDASDEGAEADSGDEPVGEGAQGSGAKADDANEEDQDQGQAPEQPEATDAGDPNTDRGAEHDSDAEVALVRRGERRPSKRTVQALDERRLELLRHPAARADGALGRLQGALAKVAVPDCSQLKAYCERANLAKVTSLANAIADATVMLGLGGVEPFVSRGDKSVGLRAYEGETPFMLIGGDHLNPDSHAFLDETALRFAVAAELTHLRFSHSRVTNREVWSGSLDLGLTGLNMLLTAAPILKGLKAPAKHLLSKVGAPAIDRWRKKLAKRESHSLASDNSQLIAAHRVMQLSADRAGLVACGDPRAAIRAMFAVHPAHLSQWPLVVNHGLRATLTRSTRADDQRERERLEDLAVRVAALLSFYLSSEYAELRAAAFARANKSP